MEGFWTLQATFDTPSCVVRPESSNDVATAVKILVKDECQFSIKGGGHTAFAGAASITNGVQIDMTGMNDVTVSEDRSVASIGAGARWLRVYQELESQGLMVAGGRDSDVGVGGLILGGGYSWFTTSNGFVCDGLVNVELVTADGKIINVNNEEHADLFVGLKGGGNNFGVATRFDLKAFEFSTMWGGRKVFSNETSDAQIQAFVNFNENAHTDPHASLINYYNYDSSTGEHVVFNVMDYNVPVADAPIFDEINAIPGVIEDTTRIAPLTSFTEELSSATQRNRNIFMTITFENDAKMYRKAVDISNAHLESVKHLPDLTWALLFQPIPSVINEASLANGGNVMGVDRNEKNTIRTSPLPIPTHHVSKSPHKKTSHNQLTKHPVYLLYLTWKDSAHDEALHKAADDTIAEIKAASVESLTDNPYIYLNYAGEFQDPLGGYGLENVKKMKKLSRKYDPKGVFQKLVPGGWKLDSARP